MTVYLLVPNEYSIDARIYGLSLIERMIRQFHELKVNQIIVVNDSTFENDRLSRRKNLTFIPFQNLKEHLQKNSSELVWLMDVQSVIDDRLLRFAFEKNGNVVLKTHTENSPIALKLTKSTFQPIIPSLDDFQSLQLAVQQLENKNIFFKMTPTNVDSYIEDLRLDCVPYFVKIESSSDLRAIENLMYEANFKGTMDFIATYIYKYPVREITRWLSLYPFITPNFVTTLSIIASFAIPALFALGEIGWAVIVGWSMFILDSVDGKLARLTVRLSKTAGIIEHATSSPAIFLWFGTLGWHFSNGQLLNFSDTSVESAWTLMALYWIDKSINGFFKAKYKRDIYDIRQIDRLFHLVACRRAIIMLIITIGYLAQNPRESFNFAALWMIVTFIFHLYRYVWIRFIKPS
ncbi:hypothetical protein K1X84_04325 [bacterium]|nr:hypothetical protein [bacterium]